MDNNSLKIMPSCDRLLEELKNLYREYLNVQQSDKAKQELIEQQNAKRIAAELREQRQQHAKAKKETDEQAAAAAAAAAAAMNAQNTAVDGEEVLSDSNDSHASDVLPSQLTMEDVVLMFDDLDVSDRDLGSTSDSDNELVDYLAHDSQQTQPQNRRRRRRELYRRKRIGRIINLKKGLASLHAKKTAAVAAASEAGAVDEKDHAQTGEEGASEKFKHDEPNLNATTSEKHDNVLSLAGQQQTATNSAARRKSDIISVLPAAVDQQSAGDYINRGGSDQDPTAQPGMRRPSAGLQKHDDEFDDANFDFDEDEEYEENANVSGNLQHKPDDLDWQKTKAQLLAKRARQTVRTRKRRLQSGPPTSPMAATAEQSNANTPPFPNVSISANQNDKVLDEEAIDSDTLSYSIRKLQYATEKGWSEAESGCCDDKTPTPVVTGKQNAAVTTPMQRPLPTNTKRGGLLRLSSQNNEPLTTPNMLLDLLQDQHEWSDGVEEDEIELNQSDSDWSEVSHENLLDDLVDDLVDECFSDAWDDYCKRYFVPKQVRQYSVYDWAYKEFVKVFQWHTVPHDCGPAGTPSVDDFMRWGIEERDFYMHQPSVGVDYEPEPPQIDSWAPGCDDPLVQVPEAVRRAATQQQKFDESSQVMDNDNKGAGDNPNNSAFRKF